jgi:hypothetical protein
MPHAPVEDERDFFVTKVIESNVVYHAWRERVAFWWYMFAVS